MSYDKLADLIYPEITTTVEELEKRYPLRQLPPGAEVLRFAPSPTGFLHTGSFFLRLLSVKRSHGKRVAFSLSDLKTQIKSVKLSGLAKNYLSNSQNLVLSPTRDILVTMKVVHTDLMHKVIALIFIKLLSNK